MSSVAKKKLDNLDLVDGQQTCCLIYGGFATNAAASFPQNSKFAGKKRFLTSDVSSNHRDDFDNVGRWDQNQDKIVQCIFFGRQILHFWAALLFNKKNWAIMSVSALQRDG